MEPYFQKALSNMVFETAAGASIRNMVDRGCTTKQIVEQLDYPMSFERVARAVTDYLLEQDILRREPPDEGESRENYTYVQERGKLGKTSFRRVALKGTDAAEGGPWNKEPAEEIFCRRQHIAAGEAFSGNNDGAVPSSDKENGITAYVPCDFGLAANKNADSLSVLNERQQEFLSGICWENARMYYRLDKRMEEIIRKLLENEKYSGDVYWRKKKMERK